MKSAPVNLAATPASPPPSRFEFNCHMCDRTQFSGSADLPAGWEILSTDRGHPKALCHECAAWLDHAA